VGHTVAFRAAVTISLAGIVATGFLAAPALAASGRADRAATSRTTASHPAKRHRAADPKRLPLTAAQLAADQRLHNMAQSGTASVTGLARTTAGAPLANVCVTAYGPSGAKSAATNESGRFLITGLRLGEYQLQYRSCGGSSAHYVTEWYGDTVQRGQSRPVFVVGQRLQALSPVTMYLADSGLGQASDNPADPQDGPNQVAGDPFGRLSQAPFTPAALLKSLVSSVRGSSAAAATPEVTQSAANGEITGVVTDPHGQGLAGICVETEAPLSGGFGSAKTGKGGRYTIRKLPAGSYLLVFYAQCGNTGNWLTQVYKGQYNFNNPTYVTVKAGKTTPNVNVVMQLGGEISGSVTGPKGKKLYGICVSPLPLGNYGELIFGTTSDDGIYHIRSVPAGSYQLGFAPCVNEDYAPTLWPDTQLASKAGIVRVKPRQVVNNINEVMQLGGIIKGTVTAAAAPGGPLGGICVAIQEQNGLYEAAGTATNASGEYTVKGLASGPYQVYFAPGCPNDGNYLAVNYPSNVTVTEGKTSAGIDAALPPGAIISGTVTSATTSAPIAGICVDLISDQELFGQTQTAPDGTYSLDQIPVGVYQVVFSGGCGNTGSYAPQGYEGTNVLYPTNIDVTADGESITGIDAAMEPGPIITGTVTDTSGTQLSGICVVAITPSEVEYGVAVSLGGSYEIANLAPGQYQVGFAPGCGNNSNLAQQWFRNQPSLATAAIVSASTGTVSGIDAVLPPSGGIAGNVLGSDGRPVLVSCVILTGLSGNGNSLIGEFLLIGNQYEITGVPLGTYQVAFAPSCVGSGYQTQYYKDKPSPVGATPVAVRAGRVQHGINAALIRGGSIAGQITSGGKPIHDMCVYAQNVNAEDDFGGGLSNRNGYYAIKGLNSGQYELEVSPCGSNSSPLATEVLPQLVVVKAPQRTIGVNLSVPRGGSIRGSVLGESPATPQPGVCALALQVGGVNGGVANTGTNGSFTITNLPPGGYQVYLGDPYCSYSAPNLAPQWYLDRPSEVTATSVPVTSGAITDLATSTLALTGTLSGTVTGPAGRTVSGICVAALPTGVGSIPVYAVTASTGTYSITDLTPGEYQVQFSSGCGASGYQAQWWHGQATQRTAAIITVAAGSTVTDIDATLRK